MNPIYIAQTGTDLSSRQTLTLISLFLFLCDGLQPRSPLPSKTNPNLDSLPFDYRGVLISTFAFDRVRFIHLKTSTSISTFAINLCLHLPISVFNLRSHSCSSFFDFDLVLCFDLHLCRRSTSQLTICSRQCMVVTPPTITVMSPKMSP